MTHFVRGHYGILIPQFIDIGVPDTNINFSGHITTELIDSKTKKIKRKLQFSNLIVDVGLNNMCEIRILTNFAGLAPYCGVGTGNTPPSNSDTNLEAVVSGGRAVYASAGSGYVPGTPDYHFGKQTYLFTESQANGNLTEIGFFDVSSAGNLFSRQLFKDDLGNPTALVKTSNDQLRVTYEVRIYPPAADIVYADQNISGSLYTVTSKVVNVGSNRWQNMLNEGMAPSQNYQFRARSQELTTRTSTATPAAIGSTTFADQVNSVYVAGNFYRDATFTWQPTNGTGDIVCICQDNPRYGFNFSPALSKTNTKRLVVNARFSWGRFTP